MAKYPWRMAKKPFLSPVSAPLLRHRAAASGGHLNVRAQARIELQRDVAPIQVREALQVLLDPIPGERAGTAAPRSLKSSLATFFPAETQALEALK